MLKGCSLALEDRSLHTEGHDLHRGGRMRLFGPLLECCRNKFCGLDAE